MSRLPAVKPVDTTANERTAKIEHNVHGLVGIRLENASSDDAAVVAREIGSAPAPIDQEPDIVVTFVDRLPVQSADRHVLLGDARFTADRMMYVAARRRAGQALIRFDDVGERCHIICEHGLPSVPLLSSILNLTFLARGAVAVHASAFTYEGSGVLVGGWSRGGKTSTLLAFMAEGGEYVGDDWSYIMDGGRRVYGGLQPIQLSARHLEDLPQFRARVSAAGRSRLFAGRWVRRARPYTPSRLARAAQIAEARLSTYVEPDRLFGQNACPLAGDLDTVLIVASHDARDIVVDQVDGQYAAQALAASSRYERLPLLSSYLKFRFVFPDRVNALLEEAEELEATALSRAFEGKNAHVIYHPYPPPTRALFEAIQPLL
jgi:hypothetical protein